MAHVPVPPPYDPPPGADPLMWRLSYYVYSEHRALHGRCTARGCRYALWPCNPSRYALVGMRVAMGPGHPGQPSVAASGRDMTPGAHDGQPGVMRCAREATYR